MNINSFPTPLFIAHRGYSARYPENTLALQPGDRLPGEAELIAHFGMSKGTIREAMRLLQAQGLVVTKTGPGGGSFVGQVSRDRARALLANYFYFKRISIGDIYKINAYIRENHYRGFVKQHGDDENNEETGYHLIQNDGGSSTMEYDDLVDTVARIEFLQMQLDPLMPDLDDVVDRADPRRVGAAIAAREVVEEPLAKLVAQHGELVLTGLQIPHVKALNAATVQGVDFTPGIEVI